jgi:hypothetical protein
MGLAGQGHAPTALTSWRVPVRIGGSCFSCTNTNIFVQMDKKSLLIHKFTIFSGMYVQLAKSSTIHFYLKLTSYQRINPCPRPCEMFRNMAFLWRGFVSTKPNIGAGGSPPVGRPRLLIQYILRYPPYLEAVSTSAFSRRAMPWWQGPT